MKSYLEQHHQGFGPGDSEDFNLARAQTHLFRMQRQVDELEAMFARAQQPDFGRMSRPERAPATEIDGGEDGEEKAAVAPVDLVEEQKCARTQEDDLNVGMSKEVSDDADKVCTAVALPSASAEMTTSDKLNKQKKQEEEKKQQQQARKKCKEHQQEKKKQGPSDSASTVCRILPEDIPDGWEATSLAAKLVASDFWETILERRESKMSAHDVPGDSNAVKPKATRKYLHRPRWGGGSWRTERAAKHKRKQQHTRPHIRGKTGAGHQNVDVTARLGKKTRLRLYRALHDATFMTVAEYNANLQKGVKLAIFDVFARRRNGATVTENVVREHTQCFTPADSMPARRRDPKEEGSLAIAAMLGKYPALWVQCLLLAAAALMVLVPPQMATEARAASNNSLPVLGRAPSFVFNGHTASDLAIGLHKHACTRRPMPEPNGATVSFESLAAPARAPISKAKDVPCTAYVTVDVSSSTPKPRVIAPPGSSTDAVIVRGSWLPSSLPLSLSSASGTPIQVYTHKLLVKH